MAHDAHVDPGDADPASANASAMVAAHVDAQVRHLAIVVLLTLALAIIGFVLLGNTDIGSGLSFAYPVALVGSAGGTANAARRVQRLQQEPIELQAAVPERLALAQTWLSPVIGATFAVVLYCIFLGGLLQGEFFPSFECGRAAFTDYRAFSTCNPTTNADAAMALVWGFIAGFGERFVPNVLDRFIGDATRDDTVILADTTTGAGAAVLPTTEPPTPVSATPVSADPDPATPEVSAPAPTTIGPVADVPSATAHLPPVDGPTADDVDPTTDDGRGIGDARNASGAATHDGDPGSTT